jgi:hypothetical protein
MRNANQLIVSGLLAGALALPGCGRTPPRAEVEGTVSVSGRPVEGIQVTFLPDPGRNTVGPSASCVTDNRGHFKLVSDDNRPGVVVGQHRVTLRDLRNVQVSRGGDRGARSGPGDAGKEKAGQVPFPREYEDATNTSLRREVKPGAQTINFDL